ncbi:MAG: Homeobox protein yox1 [Ramalina farinacea]|uniref:Homeobox protein yox1 n=1 Tax=Ramalina farinacea TaxID=258253 RepID=A0AA43TXX2_9LECA|nr:Homeobox protein yox1 [Ramalina farinacea]
MDGSEDCPSSEAVHDHDAKVNGGTQDAEYAFLVHSRESLSQGSSPSIDNQRLVRQKRRRTSPQDHAYLEAEYDRNPKPDKVARQDIVKHVALGEKEVQVRFSSHGKKYRIGALEQITCVG